MANKYKVKNLGTGRYIGGKVSDNEYAYARSSGITFEIAPRIQYEFNLVNGKIRMGYRWYSEALYH